MPLAHTARPVVTMLSSTPAVKLNITSNCGIGKPESHPQKNSQGQHGGS